MADFSSHLTGAAISSGLVSSTLCVTGIYGLYEVVLFWLVGTIAGILPDIDSDNSKALSGIFSFLGILASSLCIIPFRDLPLLHLWALMFSCFIFTRYVVSKVFASWTIHRGIYHSLLACASFSLAGSLISTEAFETRADFSWAIGISIFTGYLTHLILDELYSVDLMNREIKRSFGTAMKPLSVKNWFGSVCLVIFCYFAWDRLPASSNLEAAIFSDETNEFISQHLEKMKVKNNNFIDDLQNKLKPESPNKTSQVSY